MIWIATIFSLIPLVYTSLEIQKSSSWAGSTEPTPPPEMESTAATRREINVQEVDGEGAKITMDDGSVWEIRPQDRAITSGWIGGSSPVIIEHNWENSVYPYTMTNSWTKSKVYARPFVKAVPNKQNMKVAPKNTK